MSIIVVFQVTIKKDTFEGTVTQHVEMTIATNFESKLDNSDSDEPSTKDIQEAYQVMYNNWLKVCKENKSLKEKVVELTKEKEVIKRAATNYEFLATKSERKV